MKKEEILEKSREENKKKDAYDLEVGYKAASAASIAMVILAFVYYTYEIVSGKGSNPAFYSLITIYNGVFWGYKAIRLEKNRGLSIASSIIWSILSIMLVGCYFVFGK